MANVTEIIKGALTLLMVRTDESAITATEGQDGLTALNDMMNEWNIDGINVGYETLDSVQDELYVNLGSIGAIKANLAVYIAPEYGRVVSDALILRAKRSKISLRSSLPLNASQYPDTLPRGSGNEGNTSSADGDSAGNITDTRFYPANTRRRCS